MPGAFSNDFTTVHDCEADTLVEVGALKAATALNDDYKIQGTNAITYGLSNATGVGTASTLGTTSAALNLSASDAHFYQWIKCFTWPSMAAHAAGGQRVSISSDAPPTAIRSVLKATVTAGGTGYSVGNELTLSGGTQTQAAVVVVTAVSGGAVTAVSPKATARGMYTVLPTNPISTTGGGGSGCTLNVAGTGNPPDGWIYGLTNNKDWFVGGSDTVIVDGWACYVVDVNGTPDLQSGSPSMASIDRAGATATIIAASKVATHAQDISRYGTGITVKDGTTGAPVTLADFLTYDNANARALGVVTQTSGIYFLAGKLTVGSASQTAVSVFKESSKVLVFQSFPVSSSFYEIKTLGVSGFVTTFQLGTFSGGVATGGVTIRGADRYTHYGGVATGLVPSIWTLTANGAFTETFLYSCAFSEMRSASLNADCEIRFCTFQNSGEITAGGALFDSCSFLDLRTTAPISASYAVRVTTTTPTLTNCNFINCATALLWDINADTNGSLDGSSFTSGGTGHAIELGTNTPTTIALTNITFTGYGGTPGSNPTPSSGSTDAAIYNNSGKTITINVSGGTTPAIRNGAGATTVVNSTVAVTVTPIAVGTEVRAYLTGTSTEVDGVESSAGTSQVLSLPSAVAVDIITLCTSPPKIPTRKENVSFSVAQNFDPFQRTDPNFNNP